MNHRIRPISNVDDVRGNTVIYNWLVVVKGEKSSKGCLSFKEAGGESPLSTALPSLFTNGKEKECLSQEPLYTFYRFSLSLPAYITEYNYVAPGILIVGIGSIRRPLRTHGSELV